MIPGFLSICERIDPLFVRSPGGTSVSLSTAQLNSPKLRTDRTSPWMLSRLEEGTSDFNIHCCVTTQGKEENPPRCGYCVVCEVRNTQQAFALFSAPNVGWRDYLSLEIFPINSSIKRDF
ncbi:hypothetical protein WAI453_000529 [Rhynchosporium graminicola]